MNSHNDCFCNMSTMHIQATLPSYSAIEAVIFSSQHLHFLYFGLLLTWGPRFECGGKYPLGDNKYTSWGPKKSNQTFSMEYIRISKVVTEGEGCTPTQGRKMTTRVPNGPQI